MLSFTMVSYADTTSVATLNVSQTERLIDKYGRQAVESFNSLVETTIPLAESGFKMVVRLQIAKGIGGLLPLFLTILSLIIIFTLNKKAEWCKYSGPQNLNAIMQVVFTILGWLLFMVALMSTYDAILYLMAPEWYAIKEILNLVK